jgi:CheY-like chemotaxis protein/predicted negative regulator of RcsB-dependent stress response
MSGVVEDFTQCTALVVDGNPNTRSILVAQMRELGLRQVLQSTRLSDARRQLELQHFDFVLCEMHFADPTTTGQDLLDDLRRNQLIPFHTVFIMITGEATYAKVAEAAESALDGYLLKPHKAVHLAERLQVARVRKAQLQPIFDAIESQDFERAIALCRERFESKGLFWLYAARVGADLLLRLERHDDAYALFESVYGTKELPWARLGMARAQVEAGRLTQAITALNAMLDDEPADADATDLLARAQFELAQFPEALASYQAAARMTPSSIARLQSAAMMTFYAGQRQQALPLLERAARVGLESRLFDAQTLVLLACAEAELTTGRGLQRCGDDFARLIAKAPDNQRLHRLAQCVDVLLALHNGEEPAALEHVRNLASVLMEPDFDIESGANLLLIMGAMRHNHVHWQEAEAVVDQLGLRFCNSRAATEMLATCSSEFAPYAERIRAAQAAINDFAESAIAHHRDGQTARAVQTLLHHASITHNARLIDNAAQLLRLQGSQLPEAPALLAQVAPLRTLAGAGHRKILLGNQRRQAGGLVLRTGPRPVQAPGATHGAAPNTAPGIAPGTLPGVANHPPKTGR